MLTGRTCAKIGPPFWYDLFNLAVFSPRRKPLEAGLSGKYLKETLLDQLANVLSGSHPHTKHCLMHLCGYGSFPARQKVETGHVA